MRTAVLDLLPLETTAAEATRFFGAKLAEHLGPGDVVALYGTLGAGKTQLVKGICTGLGLDAREVHSPTFTILHEYDTGHLPVYHFDAYRIRRPDEFFELGYEEYFYGDGLCFVEWPERIEALLPAEALRLRLAHRGGDRRLIELVSVGAPTRRGG